MRHSLSFGRFLGCKPSCLMLNYRMRRLILTSAWLQTLLLGFVFCENRRGGHNFPPGYFKIISLSGNIFQSSTTLLVILLLQALVPVFPPNAAAMVMKSCSWLAFNQFSGTQRGFTICFPCPALTLATGDFQVWWASFSLPWKNSKHSQAIRIQFTTPSAATGNRGKRWAYWQGIKSSGETSPPAK